MLSYSIVRPFMAFAAVCGLVAAAAPRSATALTPGEAVGATVASILVDNAIAPAYGRDGDVIDLGDDDAQGDEHGAYAGLPGIAYAPRSIVDDAIATAAGTVYPVDPSYVVGENDEDDQGDQGDGARYRTVAPSILRDVLPGVRIPVPQDVYGRAGDGERDEDGGDDGERDGD